MGVGSALRPNQRKALGPFKFALKVRMTPTDRLRLRAIAPDFDNSLKTPEKMPFIERSWSGERVVYCRNEIALMNVTLTVESEAEVFGNPNKSEDQG